MTMDETVAVLDEFLKGSEPNLIVTADSSGLVIAQEDPDLAEIYQAASLATADSIGVVWALKRKGAKASRVSGVDLVSKLCDLSAAKGYRIGIIGAAPGIADQAAERLRLLHPGVNIVGTRHGYFPCDDDEVVAQEVKVWESEILFVAMGIPRQEKFIQKTLPIIQAKVALGVGGSFDVFSGKVKRAPKIVQRLHLEWLWRLLSNPKKIHKVKMLPKFVCLVLKDKE
ncbi:MAG: WecB/TagA/CpsF family glycosyltransferase [Fimbriimonadaceae bacterium]|nr:WecB/TagA/CpsF family glycosyltransferase [Fimbriimonadaceae bacterium]